jgi:hypothetical protein
MRCTPTRLGSLLVSVLIASACGNGATVGGGSVTLGPHDAGRNVTLHTGDRLLLQVGSVQVGSVAAETAPSPAWRILGFPREQLGILTRDELRGRFEFIALTPGSGQIRLAMTVPCDPAVARQPDAIGCPVGGGEEPTDARGGSFPVRLFTVTVNVR